ncbi:hypothetical protein ACFLS4_03315 [Bacteroidota bacterium]
MKENSFWIISSSILALLTTLILLVKYWHEIKNIRLRNKELKEKPSSKKENKEQVKNLVFKIEDIIENDLQRCNLTQKTISELIEEEFINHPIFLNNDYESIKIPIKGQIFIQISKEDNNVTVEKLFKTTVKEENLFKSWNELNTLYINSKKLKFRKNQDLLIRKSEFNKTYNSLKKLILKLNEYIHTSKYLMNEELFVHLHKLKNETSVHLVNAQYCYDEYNQNLNKKKLGETIVHLENIISSIHKILITYSFPV